MERHLISSSSYGQDKEQTEENSRVEKNKSEINDELEFLNRAINSLEENVKRLQEKLDTVLTNEKPTKVDETCRPNPSSRLGLVINENSHRLFAISDRLNDLEDRIAL